MKKLKERWGIQTNTQLAIIFIVFAITGSLSAWISTFACNWLGLTKNILGLLYTPIRLLIIFPVYQVLLVLNGFLFGQFQFFWAFEKRMLIKMGLGFLLKNKF
jgi:hypothetical protein